MIASAQVDTQGPDFPKELPAMLIRGEITLGEAFGLDSDALYSIARLAFGLLNSGSLNEAKQIYSGLVAADPYDSVFHCHLAAVHHRLGELDEAFQHYTEALNFNVANIDALVGRAEIQLARGEVAAGAAALKKAIEMDGDAGRASALRARGLLLSLRHPTAKNRPAKN